jgi:hypothetical protein
MSEEEDFNRAEIVYINQIRPVEILNMDYILTSYAQ